MYYIYNIRDILVHIFQFPYFFNKLSEINWEQYIINLLTKYINCILFVFDLQLILKVVNSFIINVISMN